MTDQEAALPRDRADMRAEALTLSRTAPAQESLPERPRMPVCAKKWGDIDEPVNESFTATSASAKF